MVSTGFQLGVARILGLLQSRMGNLGRRPPMDFPGEGNQVCLVGRTSRFIRAPERGDRLAQAAYTSSMTLSSDAFRSAWEMTTDGERWITWTYESGLNQNSRPFGALT